MKRHLAVLATFLVVSQGTQSPADSAVSPELKRSASEAVSKAVTFLRGEQRADGSFAEGDFGPSVTGLVVTGLLEAKAVTINDPLVANSLAYLKKHVHPDGGIYLEGGKRNYPTAICIMAFSKANKDGRYDDVIKNAVAYLKGEQWDEGEGVNPDHPKYGGAGYGRKTRPDLSNTAFMLEALKEAGIPKDDPAFQRAMLFVSRCQNLTGEGANDLPQAQKGEKDGGFYYTPAEDYNPGGHTPEGGLRSYASMTYAGLKSFIYAGVDKDDRRVEAAKNWIKSHYSVKENPGLDQQGLYYYYHTFAKALAALEIDQFEDHQGAKHNWREDLLKELLAKQNANGSWSNPTTRWAEGDPRLVTGYVLMTIGQILEEE